MERVEDDVAFGLENRRWPVEEMRTRVPEALAEAGLAGSGRALTQTLSGGQQQRVALAGTLAPQPGVLVLDEPTANLDPAGAEAFVARLGRLRGARSATIVLIEHRVELVWPLADRVLVLGRDGRPIAFGAPAAVVRESGAQIVRAGVWLPRDIERQLGAAAVSARQTPPDRGATRLDGRAGQPPAVEARALAFGYGRDESAVADVDLTIRAGERLALVGPNGSGKSTLGRLLVGLLRPDRGAVSLFGATPHRLAARRLARLAGYVFQDPEEQFLTTRVADEVQLGLRPHERARVPSLMDALRLPLGELGDRSPFMLSGGEARRLSVACCLVRDPRLLVLDEPTFGQDRNGHEDLVAILRERVEAGAAVVAATHDTRFVAEFAARIVTLSDGRIASDKPA